MVEKARRAKVERPRPDADPAWEVFARDDEGDFLRYVGTVRAEDADEAHRETTRLFCWYAYEVWVCPADEMQKFSADAAVDEDGELAVPKPGTESRTHEL
jgi:rSAM-partnered protein